MKRVAFATALSLAAAIPALPAAADGPVYRVTITNLTRGQIFSPPVLATHSADTAIFLAGQPASDEMAAVAEDADNSGLVDALSMDPEVFRVVAAEDGIPPGATASWEIEARGRFGRLSFVSMLVSTNDAFTGVSGLPITGGATPLMERAPAYDAGTEANSEDCAYIPGPPCGMRFSHDPADAEGYVHIHAGVHGLLGASGLEPADHDWRNPVARVLVERVSE